LGYIGCGLTLILSIAMPHNLNAHWFNKEIRGAAALPYVISIATVMLVILVAMHKLLYSKKANNFFNKKAESDVTKEREHPMPE